MPKKLKSKKKIVKRSKKRPNPLIGKTQRYSIEEIKATQLRIGKILLKLVDLFENSDINFVINRFSKMPTVANQGKFNQFGTYLAMIETGLLSVKAKFEDGQIEYLG